MAGAPAAMMDHEVTLGMKCNGTKRDGTWVIDTTGKKSDPDRFSLEGFVLSHISYLNR